jgi:RNA polymerase sigma-70 factor, ECF subfamily
MSAEQQRWLAGLYESNYSAVVRRCGVILKSSEDAADAAQEVFLIALNSLAPQTEDKRARAWLLTVAQNHCVDLLRRRKRFGRALVTLGANDARDDLESGVVDRDFVDGVLRQLSLRERRALWQSAVENRSLADIATGLQLSYSAAAQVVHRARQRAVRMAASGAAAIIMVLRFPRAVRRLLERIEDSGSMLVAQRVLALAALPIVAAVTFPSSTAPGTSHATRPMLTVPAAPGGVPTGMAPGGVAALLAPLSAGADQGVAGATPGLIQPGVIPAVGTPTLKSLADQLEQSTGRVAPGAPPLPSVPPLPDLSPLPGVPPLPHLSPLPSVPPVGSVPPGPSLPPPGP